jgi:hypothetical protein
MTTCRDIITRAMQEPGIVAMGETPTAAESAAGLTRLNTVVASAFGNSVGEGLIEITVDASEEIDANTRCVVSGRTGAITITLPANPSNGARFQIIDADGTFDTYNVTVARNGRKLEGAYANLTLSTEGLNRTWLYRADLADWVRITALGLNDDLPFPTEHEDAFVVELALRLSPTFGATLTAESAAAHRSAMRRLRAAYRQRVVTGADQAVLRMSAQSIPIRRGAV